MQVLSPIYYKMAIKLMAMQPSACKKIIKYLKLERHKKIKRQVKGHLKCESQLMYTTNILFVLMSWTAKDGSRILDRSSWHINFLSTKETSLFLNWVCGGVDCPYLRGRYLLHYWQFVLIFILDVQVWKQPLWAILIFPLTNYFSPVI